MTHLDGNALAGVLADLFADDLTDAVARCASCGRESMIAEGMLYLVGPAAVLRCVHCTAELLSVGTTSSGARTLSMSGIAVLRLPDPD